MNFQGAFHGSRTAFDSRLTEIARQAELNRLQQISQMNQMQINRLQEITRLTRQSEVAQGRFEDPGYPANEFVGSSSRDQTFVNEVDYQNFDGRGSGYRDSDSYGSREPIPPGIDDSVGDDYSRGRNRDRDQRDIRSRDRDRDRDRRRESDRDRRSGGESQDRDRGRHHSRDRSRDRDRSPVDSYSRSDSGSGYGQDYDMEDDGDRGSERRGRGRDGRSDEKEDRMGTQPSRKIILRSMHTYVDEKMINAELMKYGLPVRDIRLIRRASGVSRGFAFVEFHNLSDAQRWMEQTQGTLLIQNQYRATLAYSIQRDRGASRDSNNMQRYDWVCSKCLGHNFKRRDYCFNCNLPRKESEKGKPIDGQEEIGNNPCNTLIFRGLDALTTEEGLVAALNQATAPQPMAPIKNVAIIRDEINTSRGFGFVEFNSVQVSTTVLDALNHLDTPLEVDGKQLLIDYAKNTFNTTMSYIQQQQAAQAQFYDNNYYNQGQQYYDHATQQYYNYNDYYNQTGNVPATTASTATSKANSGENSTNNAAAVAHAAIQQAQAVKNLQKQVQKKTVGSSEYVTVNGVDYPVYPPPDTSQYQYEETSGYYYDPTTQLYYDANSQYYYNSTTGQFMYWDAEKSTYLPAPTNSETTATSSESQENADKKDGKEKKDTKEKSKMAKKIAKDMEKWAKSMNAQKEAQKDVFKKPIGAPMSISMGKQESAAADAGFAILQKAKEDKSMPAPSSKPESPAAGSSTDKPGLVASYGGDSDSGEEDDPAIPVDESKLVDWTKLACLLCKRQFQSKEILSKHTQVSDLHKKNLESLQRSREASAMAKVEYRDRAKERRQKYGAPGPPEPHRRSGGDNGEESEPTFVPEEPTKFGIGGDNIGNKLLQKMGWSHGQGLGKDNQGRTDPVEAKRRNQAAGLGARGAKVVADVGDTYKDALKKSMFARFSEIE